VSDFFFIFVIISASFFIGQALQFFTLGNHEKIRNTAILLAYRFAIPLSLIGAIWNLQIIDLNIAFVPLIGAIILLSGFGIGLTLCKLVRFNAASMHQQQDSPILARLAQ